MKIRPHAEHRDATEVDVGHFEMAIAARLPDDYREFLIRYNGGYPDPSGFRGGNDVLNFFFGLLQKRADLNYETLAQRGFIPGGMIPIARPRRQPRPAGSCPSPSWAHMVLGSRAIRRPRQSSVAIGKQLH